MSKLNFEAIIFDLDGVITQTASIHNLAWKKTFDEYLLKREKEYNEAFIPFTRENDYLPFVDGKPRYDGVKSFLSSRHISIPFGDPNNSPNMETICGLGNKKNQFFLEIIEKGDVKVFDSTIKLIHLLKNHGIKIGVASSSKNCEDILKATKIIDLFETRVDGIISSSLGLKGKPDPDIFITACNNLGKSYDKTIIVEDAASGVKAGFDGNFGLIIGVAREKNHTELLQNGADIVVSDLEEITLDTLTNWFSDGILDDSWSLTYHGYVDDKKEESKREALLTVGNGYLGTRGAMEEFNFKHSSYPATYIAGVYNKLESEIKGRIVVNEDIVNCPNWLPLTYKINHGNWFSLHVHNLVRVSRKLDFKTGLLSKHMESTDLNGNITIIESERIASMNNPHLTGLRYKITPKNYSGLLRIRATLDGLVTNGGVERYKELNSKHLIPISEKLDKSFSHILVETSQSQIKIIMMSYLLVYLNNSIIQPDFENYEESGKVRSEFEFELKKGDSLEIQKICSIYTSNDPGCKNNSSLIDKAKSSIYEIRNFDELYLKSKISWKKIWEQIDIQLEGDRIVQKLLRLHMYHLMSTASPHNELLDVGIPARGLHGEAYRGHIFWDTIFILPFYDLFFPNIAKSALMYRYRRLDKARKIAEENNSQGIIFPWQSGSTGEEETQKIHLNPKSGEWIPDHSSIQRHINLAIAYNIWNYFWITEDKEFLINYGAEIYLEICKFWISVLQLNAEGKYEIRGVMGPDEFHEMLPKSHLSGLKDNFYTNIMVAWLLDKVNDILIELEDLEINRILNKIGLSKKDVDSWEAIKSKINIVISNEGIIPQFDGYFDLKELDWTYYKEKNTNIQRMDRILKAEGKSTDEFKVSKQADVLMAFYLLTQDYINHLLSSMNIIIPEDILQKNFDYYFQRTSHGSTLSKVVHSRLLNLLNLQDKGYELFIEGLKSDYTDIQGGTTGEGIHVGVMSGTIMEIFFSMMGIDFSSKNLRINPKLPTHWRKLTTQFWFKKINYRFNITQNQISITAQSKIKKEEDIYINNRLYVLNLEKSEILSLKL